MTRYFPAPPRTFHQRLVFLITGLLLILAGLLLLTEGLNAQVPVAHVSWTAVTQSVNGQPLTGVTYNVWRGTALPACADAIKVNSSPITTTTYNDPGVTMAGIYCYQVSAVAGLQESGKSVAVRFAPADLVPAVPGGVSVTLTVTLTLTKAP